MLSENSNSSLYVVTFSLSVLSCDPRESLGARRGLSRLSAWENCVSGGGGGSPAVFAVLWQIIAKKWPAAVRTHSLCCSLIYLDLCMCDGSTSDKINLHSAGTYTLHTGIHIIWYFNSWRFCRQPRGLGWLHTAARCQTQTGPPAHCVGCGCSPGGRIPPAQWRCGTGSWTWGGTWQCTRTHTDTHTAPPPLT